MAGKYELEKFEYLFVDIEQNQTPGTNGIEDREPIQIGAVATDESMNLKKSFSRAMRLSSEEKYKYEVVWTQDTYELLKRGMDTYGYSMPRHSIYSG